MSDATEYRPGDIAMVDSVVCLWRDHDQSQLKPAGWYDLRGLLMPYHGRQVVGPVLGNVGGIEAVQKLRDAAQAFLDAYDDVGVEVWWPEESEALREVLERG